VHVRNRDVDLWHAVAGEKTICQVFRCQIHPGSSKCKQVYGLNVLCRAVNGGGAGRGCYIIIIITIFITRLAWPLSKSRLLAPRSIMTGDFWAPRRQANSSTRSYRSAPGGDVRLHSGLRFPGTKPIMATLEPTTSIRGGTTSPCLGYPNCSP